MGKLFVVIKREYLERVRSKWFVIVTLFGPLFFGVIMVLPGYLSIRGMREARVGQIRIVDATGAGLGERIADRMVPPPRPDTLPAAARVPAPARPPRPAVDVVAASEVEAQEAALIPRVQSREIVGYLIVDSATITSGLCSRMSCASCECE